MYKLAFSSACSPVFLPVNEFGEIKLDLIPQYFDYLYKNGIRSFFVNGGCGEFSSLTVEERKQILEKWIEVSKNDVQIVVNIGTSNLADTIELGNHALSFSGLYGVAIVPPYYMSINDHENLVDYLMLIADRLSRKIPILYYHIPSVSKVDIDLKQFLTSVKKHQFHQLAAIKCTDSNFDNFLTLMDGIKSNNLSIDLYCGHDSLLYDALVAGGKGGILGLCNIKPKAVNAVIENPESNKFEMLTISKILNLSIEFSQTERVNLIGLLKIATEYYSNIQLGPMRKPYAVSENKVRKFKELLNEI